MSTNLQKLLSFHFKKIKYSFLHFLNHFSHLTIHFIIIFLYHQNLKFIKILIGFLIVEVFILMKNLKFLQILIDFLIIEIFILIKVLRFLKI